MTGMPQKPEETPPAEQPPVPPATHKANPHATRKPQPPPYDDERIDQTPADEVDEASMESFPASDPPAYTSTHA